MMRVLSRRSVWLAPGALPLLLVFTSPAFAQRRDIHPDLTVSAGLTIPPARPTIGVAVGGGGTIVRFEIDIASTVGTATPARPSAGGISVDVLLQSRPSARGFQYYGTGGITGLYGEQTGSGGSGEMSGMNIGGGVKLNLTGPLRLRLDYRLFIFGSAPDASRNFVPQLHPQRVLVGLNVGF